MVARISLDVFFDSLRKQGGYPIVDTLDVRAELSQNLAKIATHYPIKSVWPVADIEFAYERHLNNSPDQMRHTREYGYMGTVNLRGYDRNYSINEWFDDFRVEYQLADTSEVREKLLKALDPDFVSWPPGRLYVTYTEATKRESTSKIRRFFGV